jgi:hypothetical protein
MAFVSKQAKPDELCKVVRAWCQGNGGTSKWLVEVMANRDIAWWVAPTGDVISGDPNARQLVIVNRWVSGSCTSSEGTPPHPPTTTAESARNGRGGPSSPPGYTDIPSPFLVNRPASVLPGLQRSHRSVPERT